MAKAVYTTEKHRSLRTGLVITALLLHHPALPDVLTHRILQEVLDEEYTFIKKLEEQCKHCSERE